MAWPPASLAIRLFGSALLMGSGSVGAQTPSASSLNDLTDTISRASAALFAAFNTCDLDRFAASLSDDLEFYHDRDGLETSPAHLVESLKVNICGKVRRELVPGSLQIYPIPDHGALEVGTHLFYEVAQNPKAGPVGMARYVHVWQRSDDGWKLSRVISYDHQPAPRP